METQKSKTVFIEYSSYQKGQHFMTVMQVTDGNRQIIGRIFREYDNVNKKALYRAEDWTGNTVFVDTKELTALKGKFKEHGKQMAMVIPINPNRQMKKEREPYHGKIQRRNEVKQVRDKKFEKGKTKEVTNKRPNEKAKNTRIEKEQDAKNTTKYKDVENTKEGNNYNEKLQGKAETDSEKPIQDEQQDNTQNVEQSTEQSDRMEELEDIRDSNSEMEQDVEVDLDR